MPTVRNRVDLPEPFKPSTPILARKNWDIILRINLFGTILRPTKHTVNVLRHIILTLEVHLL
jgi:hypothetical protein